MQKRKISNELLDEVENKLQTTENYGPEERMILNCLTRFPNNTDPDIVAMKIGLIDITNSTHLSQYKKRINMAEFAEHIAGIRDIDARIKDGDPEVVNEIARSNGKINLFSFATKYCCYHNRCVYGKDDYSILDTVLKEHLPEYFEGIKTSQIQKMQDDFAYEEYNQFISDNLDKLGITTEDRKKKFDHLVWFENRKH